MAGKKQLGQILVDAGIIDEFQLKSALGYQKQWGGRLGRVLVENRFVTEEALVTAVHAQTGVAIVNLDTEKIVEPVVKMVPVEMAERHNVMPLRIEEDPGKSPETLIVAMSDPTNLGAQDEVQFTTGKRIKVLLATESSITRFIRRFYHGEEAPAELAPAIPVDPEKIQFSGDDIAPDDMVLVQGKLESVPASGPAGMPEVTPLGDFSLDDPFAELESLAKEPPPAMPEPAPPPPPPAAVDPMPPPRTTAPAAPEDDLPEVEIVEEISSLDLEPIDSGLPPEATPPGMVAIPPQDQAPPPVDESSTFEAPESVDIDVSEEPTPPHQVAVSDLSSIALSGAAEDGAMEDREEPFGISGDLLGPGSADDNEAAEKPAAEAPPGSAAMEALLSRVGIQTGGSKPTPSPSATEPPARAPKAPIREVQAPEPVEQKGEAPPSAQVDTAGLLDDVQKFLDGLEAADGSSEPPLMAKASHLIAAVIRLLLRKEVITDSELLDELKRR